MVLPTDMIKDPTTGQMVTREQLQAKYDQMKASQAPAGTNLTSNDPNIPDYLKYRNSPTVATSTNPVISKTFTNDLAYDETNPEDYLMKLNARVQATGKKPTEAELYNMYKAQRALTDKTTTNPMQAQLDEILKQYNLARGEEETRDKTALEAYKTQLDTEYAQKIAEAEAQGKKQQTAAQGVYSFSGFGRSSVAADKMVEIEKSTQSAISALNQAKQTAILLKEAELRGDDPESLKGLYASLESSRKAANDWQIESIKKTAEANASSGASYIESINNFMKAAADSGIEIGDPKVVAEYANLARNADGTINETFIKTLPEDVQAIIRSAAQTSGQGEAPTVKNFGTTKNPRYMQWNGKDWVQVSGAMGGAGGGTKTGLGGGAAQGQQGVSNPTELINYNVKFKNTDQSNAFTYATRIIEASQIFNDLEDQISGLSKAEYIKQKALGKLPYGSALQSDLIQKQEQAERNFVNAVLRKESGAAIADSEFNNAQKQYLPQPGDTAETLEQKRKNRLTALKGIAAATGNQPALQPAITAVSQKQASNKPAEYVANKTYNVGDRVIRNGKTYVLGADKKFRLSQ